MLFTFGKIWKFLLTLVAFWLFYAFFGYEIAVITALGCILGSFWATSNHLI